MSAGSRRGLFQDGLDSDRSWSSCLAKESDNIEGFVLQKGSVESLQLSSLRAIQLGGIQQLCTYKSEHLEHYCIEICGEMVRWLLDWEL